MSLYESGAEAPNEILATRTFDAPRELVFRMWTEREHLEQWWGPRGFSITTHEIDVRPGGVWRFVMHGPDGTDYKNHIEYREVIAPERIAYGHTNGPLFEASATFDEENGRTRVTVRMVFESAELRDRIAAEFGAVEGLHQTLDRLGERLANTGAFVISREFDAPRELMFRVWTEVAHLEQWWGSRGVTVFSCTNDFRPGGMMLYGLRTPDGGDLWGRWIYREILPPSRLVFVMSFSDAGGGVTRNPFGMEWPLEMLTTVTFEESAGRTTVVVKSAAFNATESERASFTAGHASMQQGWTGTFDRLGGYLGEVQR